jgi:hypothetical protein
MSELRNANRNRDHIRRQLLATVSIGVLLAAISTAVEADDGSSDRAPFWIELGGQFAGDQNPHQAFLSPFIPAAQPPFEIISPAEVEKPASTSLDGSAKISFEPVGTNWIFSAGVTFGRSGRNQFLRQMTQQPDQGTHGVYVAYQNVTSKSTQSHAILDFSAGKDVGLGGINSSINLGVRYVQFTTKSDALIQSQPTNVGFFHPYHRIKAHLLADRKFTGVGPSLSWDASAAIIGNHNNGEIAIDWGVNGAVLFGRQSIRGHHQTTNVYYTYYYSKSHHRYSAPLNRSKQVTVPNVGGFAGLSWRYPNAKVSVGYRADFFFGAMDGGIDTAHRENVGFYGPFASVSVGLGG